MIKRGSFTMEQSVRELMEPALAEWLTLASPGLCAAAQLATDVLRFGLGDQSIAEKYRLTELATCFSGTDKVSKKLLLALEKGYRLTSVIHRMGTRPGASSISTSILIYERSHNKPLISLYVIFTNQGVPVSKMMKKGRR